MIRGRDVLEIVVERVIKGAGRAQLDEPFGFEEGGGEKQFIFDCLTLVREGLRSLYAF